MTTPKRSMAARPMAQATGKEILEELAHQLRLTVDQRAEFFDDLRCEFAGGDKDEASRNTPRPVGQALEGWQAKRQRLS